MKRCSGLNQERNLHQIKQRLQDKTVQNKYVAGFWCERRQEEHFITEGWVIVDYGLVFELKMSWWICFSFCLLQMLTDGLEWCGLLWCFYQLFGLSFWRHPFTAEHPLLRHWWNDTFLQTWWRNMINLSGKLISLEHGVVIVLMTCECCWYRLVYEGSFYFLCNSPCLSHHSSGRLLPWRSQTSPGKPDLHKAVRLNERM